MLILVAAIEQKANLVTKTKSRYACNTMYDLMNLIFVSKTIRKWLKISPIEHTSKNVYPLVFSYVRIKLEIIL